MKKCRETDLNMGRGTLRISIKFISCVRIVFNLSEKTVNICCAYFGKGLEREWFVFVVWAEFQDFLNQIIDKGDVQ